MTTLAIQYSTTGKYYYSNGMTYYTHSCTAQHEYTVCVIMCVVILFIDVVMYVNIQVLPIVDIHDNE